MIRGLPGLLLIIAIAAVAWHYSPGFRYDLHHLVLWTRQMLDAIT